MHALAQRPNIWVEIAASAVNFPQGSWGRAGGFDPFDPYDPEFDEEFDEESQAMLEEEFDAAVAKLNMPSLNTVD